MINRKPLHDYSTSRAFLIGAWDYRHLLDVGSTTQNSLTRMANLLTGPQCGWPTQMQGDRNRLRVL